MGLVGLVEPEELPEGKLEPVEPEERPVGRLGQMGPEERLVGKLEQVVLVGSLVPEVVLLY